MRLIRRRRIGLLKGDPDMRRVACILGSFAVLGVAAAWPTPSPAMVTSTVADKVTSTFAGRINQVSLSDLKVVSKTGEEFMFLIGPSFKNIWSADGKTRYKLEDLRRGNQVQVMYHSVLGPRHADKIILLHK
jgi:hypothetical protein